MNGLATPVTGINNKLCIHYLPGARGDFLASILTGTFTERTNGALAQPNYLKVHYGFDKNIINNQYTVIRIDDNKSIDNIMQITVNGFLKNPVYMLEDIIDHYYTRIKYTHYSCREIINPDSYNYWIDFSRLADIKFLQDIYYHYHQNEMSNELLALINENISKQKDWRTIPGLDLLSLLVDFELRFNLLNWVKTFSIQEYMSASDPGSLLTLKNYSKEPFLI
jgi:hypothetical protein